MAWPRMASPAIGASDEGATVPAQPGTSRVVVGDASSMDTFVEEFIAAIGERRFPWCSCAGIGASGGR
jgi:hypothetical protein